MTCTRFDLRHALALALAISAQPVAAQTPAPPPEAAAAELSAEELITVTGTRIKGLDLSGATPAIQIDREAIRDSGATTVIDLLADLPVTSGGGGTFSTATGGALSSDTPAGAAGVGLRGLGTSSTLTLINGRRASVSAFANGQESFIDVNSIPLAAIERVEILPSGASASYGADAVAGVVNYVLRKDFEGLELSASYGDSTADSNESKFNVNGVFGAQIGDNHITLVVDYFKRQPMFLRDRAISRDSVRPSQQGFYPSFNDLFFQTLDQTEEPGDGGCAAEDFGVGNFGEFCEVDNNDFVSAADRLETIGGIFMHDLKITDRLTWFNEVLYQNTKSRGTSSPANFSRAPVDPENPYWPEALQQDIVDDAGGGDFSDFFGFPIYAWGKLIDPRAVTVESDSFRLTTGFEYELPNGWNAETAFVYGGNDRVQRGLTGLVRSQAFYDANLGNLCTDGSRVNRWDVDPARPDASFVGETCEDIGKQTLWYNPFGGQTQQQDGIAEALQTQAERRGKSRVYSYDLNLSGDVFTFGENTVKAAFGGDFRRETLSDTPSGEAVATNDNPEPILGFSSTSADAERNQWSVYAEFYIPFGETFDLQLAGRYDEYDDFGGDFNPKVAARWQPIDWLTLRGNWSTSFRAPSLAQSGAGVLLSSYTVDCSELPQACDGDPTADGESLLSEDVGNPELGPENARTYGFGLMIEPTRDISFKVDYWNVRQEDLVGIDEEDFIRRALAGEFTVAEAGDLPTGVPGVEVTNGFVTDAHFQITNLGYQETDGIDISYTHSLPETGIGDFTLLLDATYIFNFKRKASDDAEVEQLAGDYLYPDFLATAKLRWRSGNWRASFTGNYTSGYTDDPSPRTLEAVGLPPDAEVEVDDYLTFDLAVSYDLTEHSYIQLTVDNIFNEDPPLVLGSSSNVDLYNHDLVGRFITLGVTYRF